MEKEQGKVNWINDYETGLNRSETEKNPCCWISLKKAEAAALKWVP